LSNHKRRNDELPIPEGLVKPSVHDEKDQISNNYKQTDDENLLSKGNKRESNEDESKVVPDGHVMFMLYIFIFFYFYTIRYS